MSDFLGGLADVLSGFHQKRRIDKEGFDWREQDAARQFARDREVQLAGQQDEDRAVGQIADVLASQDGEPDTSAIPEQVLGSQKEWRVRQALGKLPERRSQIEAAKAYSQLQRDLLRGDQRKEQIELTADEARERDRLKFQRDSGRELNPAEKARLEALERMNNARIAASGQGGGASDRPYRSPQTQNEQGETGTYMIYPDGRREWFPAGATATMRDTAGMALTIGDSLQDMKDAAEKGVVNGPIAGRLSQWWQAAYPSGNEYLFDSAARRLVDIVYTKSGKQINQQEMEILKGLIPTRAKGNIEEQITQFENYAEGLLRRYSGMRAPQAGGAPSRAPAAGGRRKFNPATGRVE